MRERMTNSKENAPVDNDYEFNAILNEETKVKVQSNFPNAGKIVFDSKGVEALHIGFLADTNEPNYYSEQGLKLFDYLDRSKYMSLLLGSPSQSKSALFIRELFKPQKEMEGVLISKYGISRPFLPDSVEKKDISNPEQFETISIFDFDAKALDLFANALDILDQANIQYIENEKKPMSKVKRVLKKAKGQSK
jgi:hypothetical protein